MKYFLIVLCKFSLYASFAQTDFQSAYIQNPLVPEGLLEAIAWNNTHMVHRDGQSQSCSGIPQPFGIMGLFDDGKDYFQENAKVVAKLSGISVEDQKLSAKNQISAYAKAIQTKLSEIGVSSKASATDIKAIMNYFSEIPNEGEGNALAKDLQVYSILEFMNSPEKSEQFNFKQHDMNLEDLFGVTNYKVLSSSKINVSAKEIRSEEGDLYQPILEKTSEYGPAIWNPAAVCNFSSRNGVAISAITIHTIQGTYAGAISWAQNCASSVSYHYVIRSSDGQVTQMLLEEDKGWHVGTENPYTIGYEHEGYVDDASWYTNEMISSSAHLSRDVVNSGYGIPPLRTYYGAASVGINTLGNCTKIKGHQHYANSTHTDPGINWDWEEYYKLINNNPSIIPNTNQNGSFYDSGGATNDYQDDEREFWLFQPANALSVTLDFTAFDLELDYDNMFIYDGDSTDAALIGSYTGTNSPGQITSTGPSLLVEFRSDCGVVSNGWEATFTANPDFTGIDTKEELSTSIYPNPTSDKISFKDIAPNTIATIRNSLGQICIQSEVTTDLDVSVLSAGYYMLSLSSESNTKEIKLIVVK